MMGVAVATVLGQVVTAVFLIIKTYKQLNQEEVSHA